jgi:hypothetical protein
MKAEFIESSAKGNKKRTEGKRNMPVKNTRTINKEKCQGLNQRPYDCQLV